MNKSKGGRPTKHLHDTPEQINTCLTCPYPECLDYCTRLRKKQPERASVLDKDGIGRRLVGEGKPDNEIAAIVGIPVGRVTYWRRKNGLPGGRYMKTGGKGKCQKSSPSTSTEPFAKTSGRRSASLMSMSSAL